MNKEVQGSLKSDVQSLDFLEKQDLINKSLISAKDVAAKKGSAKKIKVDAGEKDGYKIIIITEKKSAATKPRSKVKDRLNNLGLNKKIVDDLTNRLEEGKINSYHISDISKTNLVEELAELDTEKQSKAIDNLIGTRNDRDLINSENISLLVLKTGKINSYLLDNWYRGILRTIEKLIQQADVSKEVINKLIPEQKKYLLKRIKYLTTKLNSIISLLEK